MSPLIYEPKSYYQCRKVNSELLYIHKQSNHPPYIIKQIPAMINKTAPDYSNARKKNGFNENIKFTPRPRKRRKRSRNILWFNLSFSSNVKTNIGKIFLRLLDKYFPKHHKYYKLFNWNNIKRSYGCLQNMSSIIQNHNTNLLKDPVASTATECSCRQTPNCPRDI